MFTPVTTIETFPFLPTEKTRKNAVVRYLQIYFFLFFVAHTLRTFYTYARCRVPLENPIFIRTHIP